MYLLGYITSLMNILVLHQYNNRELFLHRFMDCYGKLGILDRIHNTDTLFRKNVHGLRHRMLHTLKSAKERFPDKSD